MLRIFGKKKSVVEPNAADSVDIQIDQLLDGVESSHFAEVVDWFLSDLADRYPTMQQRPQFAASARELLLAGLTGKEPLAQARETVLSGHVTTQTQQEIMSLFEDDWNLYAPQGTYQQALKKVYQLHSSMEQSDQQLVASGLIKSSEKEDLEGIVKENNVKVKEVLEAHLSEQYRHELRKIWLWDPDRVLNSLWSMYEQDPRWWPLLGEMDMMFGVGQVRKRFDTAPAELFWLVSMFDSPAQMMEVCHRVGLGTIHLLFGRDWEECKNTFSYICSVLTEINGMSAYPDIDYLVARRWTTAKITESHYSPPKSIHEGKDWIRISIDDFTWKVRLATQWVTYFSVQMWEQTYLCTVTTWPKICIQWVIEKGRGSKKRMRMFKQACIKYSTHWALYDFSHQEHNKTHIDVNKLFFDPVSGYFVTTDSWLSWYPDHYSRMDPETHETIYTPVLFDLDHGIVWVYHWDPKNLKPFLSPNDIMKHS